MEQHGLNSEELAREAASLRARLARLEELGIDTEHLTGGLRVRTRRYRTLFHASTEGLFIATKNGVVFDVNDALLNTVGYTREEFAGISVIDLFVRKEDRERFAEELEGKGLVRDFEVRLRRKDGAEIIVQISATVWKGERGMIEGYQGILRDVTRARSEQDLQSLEEIQRRKQAQEALRVSESKYRLLFEQSKDVVYISTPGGRFVDINPAGVELFGYSSREEILEIELARDLYADSAAREELLRQVREKGYVKDYEITLKTKDGRKIFVSGAVTLMRDEEGNVAFYWGILHDMTAHKNLEQQVIQAQKMESIGRLVGGVAHDFNNILTGIIGFADLALMSITPDHPLWFDMDQIKKQGERAAALTRQLLAFSSRQLLERKNIDLNTVMKDLHKFLGRVIGEHIEVRMNIAPQLKTIYADRAQIEQVLMNLCVNARDAMPDGGCLTLETSNVTLDNSYQDANTLVEPGDYVVVSVSDSGVGMTSDVKQHLFEPFFTTKPKGRGTGLGLATVYGIVKQHSGFVHIYSEPGKGTCVKLYFKALPERETAPEREAVIETSSNGNETILLAEDEPAVRELVDRILHQRGYSVLTACDGEEAVKVFDAHRERIKMAILDMVMPKLSGEEVYQHIKAHKPGLRYLFMSGYAAGGIHEDFDLRPGTEFLQKPFNPGELARRVREILDKAPEIGKPN